MKKSAVPPMMKELWAHLFRKPATSKYPLVKAEVPEGFRGKQVYDINLCISCGLCARDCPAKAIEMVEIEGKRRPLFHLDLCVFCYQCAESCPRNAIKSSRFFELATTNKADLVVNPTGGAQTSKGEQQ
ncbi:MAG: NADH-quinone oxidoreductase subunit I [Candidatus Bathyarchaeia archaeon]